MKRLMMLGTLIPTLLLGLASAGILPKKLIYNTSASAPLGLYWIDQKPILRGDYIVVSVPPLFQNFVDIRGYLPPNIPLIKRVMGTVGDRVCRKGYDVSINNLAVAIAKSTDNLGRTMPDWQGCHMISKDQIFLLQDHPDSFDGRYFGPIDRSLIIGRATRLDIFDHWPNAT